MSKNDAWMSQKANTILQKHYQNMYLKHGHQKFWIVIDPQDMKKWYVLYHDLEGEHEGGEYLMLLEAQPRHPFEPPHFQFLTPNGKFQKEKKPCVDIGHYHSDNWPPELGMYGFASMIYYALKSDEVTNGIAMIKATKEQNVKYAEESVNYNQTVYPEIMKWFVEERTRKFEEAIENDSALLITDKLKKSDKSDKSEKSKKSKKTDIEDEQHEGLTDEEEMFLLQGMKSNTKETKNTTKKY